MGGFLVPLRLDYLVRDFARDAGLPVVVVAAPGLGTINHTLLTVEAVRAAGLEVLGVVLTPWPSEPERLETSNLEAIRELGRGTGRDPRPDRSRRPGLVAAARLSPGVGPRTTKPAGRAARPAGLSSTLCDEA